ncbi:MAG TPA: NAD(P)/FAD-dependent oxidoreductase [Acidimicrobiales bacterium]
MFDAVVVGAGPNGLAAAITLARAGRSVCVLEANERVGGGSRSAELTEPGFVHDVCSAIHAFGAVTPFFATSPLREHGLEWVVPEIAVAHPLGGDRAAYAVRSVRETADVVGSPRYESLMRPIVERWDDLTPQVLGPLVRVPRHPVTLARFGIPALLPATVLGRALGDERAAALFAGCAAHAIRPLQRPLTSSFGLMLLASAHLGGWPVARGGSQSIADALASLLRSLGGEIRCGVMVRSMADVPPARAVLFDLAPRQVAAIAGDRLPASWRRRAERFRHGSGACKVDYALDEPVPWLAEPCRRAGTVHVGGTLDEIAAAEDEVARGRHAPRPFVLVAQQSVCDPSRAPEGKATLWAYCHVPNGSDLDVSDTIERQIERFAPGFRDVVRARHVMTAAQLERYNPAYVGGDITGGANDTRQLVFRPFAGRPYRTADPALFLCSASTPPGGGVHGLCGEHAARVALRTVLR